MYGKNFDENQEVAPTTLSEKISLENITCMTSSGYHCQDLKTRIYWPQHAAKIH